MAETPRGPARSDDQWASRSLRHWRLLAAVSSLVMLLVLAWAPTKEQFQPWRRAQQEYNELAVAYGSGPVPVEVRQVWIPEAQRADRCGSCHLGAFGERALPVAPFTAHPEVPHSPETYGCTYCHSGQGWSTVADDAHGEEGSWRHPMFRLADTEAGCGSCHSGLVLPLPEEVEDAPDLIAEYGCDSCHGEDAVEAPSLRGIALRGIPDDWVARHRGLTPPSDDVRVLAGADSDELATLGSWLETRVGAPRLARGKMVFHQLGCLGCHRRGSVGGDVGPDLTAVGDTDVRDVEGDLAGPGTLASWMSKHLIEPQALDPDSNMPAVDLEELEREGDLDDLVTFLLSLRAPSIPDALSPPERVRSRFGLGRDFPTSGRGLYLTFCGSCHGFYATGADMEILGLVTPMVGTRGYLSTVTPRYLSASIERGRRGRYMPAWGADDGGLEPPEIESIVQYLVDKGHKPRELIALTGPADRDHGREVFARRCGACHAREEGAAADGETFGTDLEAAGGLQHFSRSVLYDAIMRGWVEEGMPSFAFLKRDDIRDLLAYLEPRLDTSSLGDAGHDGLHSHLGLQVWIAKCGECHGSEGEGGSGPLLNTEPYLEWATDPYLAVRIGDHAGRVAQASVGTLSDDDLDALLDHMRSWMGRAAPLPPSPPDPEAVNRGRALYEPRCVECHGEAGSGKTGPALANVDFLELVSRPFLVMSILEGRSGTTMVAWREKEEDPLSVQDAFDIADYIISLGSSGGMSETAR